MANEHGGDVHAAYAEMGSKVSPSCQPVLLAQRCYVELRAELYSNNNTPVKLHEHVSVLASPNDPGCGSLSPYMQMYTAY